MKNPLKKIRAYLGRGNRLLVFALSFLVLFSFGSYAFAAALFHPGDNVTDPTCAPGATGCYVDGYPDQTGNGGEFLRTDGAGNVSWQPNIPTFAVRTVVDDHDYLISDTGDQGIIEMHPTHRGVSVTMPAHPITGDSYTIKNKGTSGVYLVSVLAGGNTIEGESGEYSTHIDDGDSATLVWNGSDWTITSSHFLNFIADYLNQLTLSDILGHSGGSANGGAAITGDNFLKFSAVRGVGISNSRGDPILGTDSNDNLNIFGYETLTHTHVGQIGFDSSGSIYMTAPTISADAVLGTGISTSENVGALNLPYFLGGGDVNGSFNSYLDTTLQHQDIIGTSDSAIFGSGDTAMLMHVEGSGSASFAEATKIGGLPGFIVGAADMSASRGIFSALTTTGYTIADLSASSSLFAINTNNHTYGLGDLSSSVNSTRLNIDDQNNYVSFSGYPNVAAGVLSTGPTHTGSGLSDISISGSYSQSYGNTYTVTIDGVNNGELAYASGGPFTAGETLTDASGIGAGSTATLDTDTGTVLLYSNQTAVGGGFHVGDTVVGSTSGASVTVAHTASDPDTFSWSSTDGGSGSAVAITTSPQLLNDSISVSFAASTGHTLNDSWSLRYRYRSGKMFELDGAAGLFTLGDVDNVGNSTKITVDDVNNLVTLVSDTDLSGDVLAEGTVTFSGITPGVACDDNSHALGYDASGVLVCDPSVSDIRLKTSITALDTTTGLAAIEQLNPVSYYWKDTTLPGTGSVQQQFGFIAQDVQKVLPNLVTVNAPTYLTPDVTYGLNYQGFTAIMVQAVKELDLKVEPLTSIDPSKNGSLASLVVQFLSDAVISIKEATIGTLRIGDQVCADDVCVTKEQFKNLLLQAGGSNSNQNQNSIPPVVPPADTAPSETVTPPADDTPVTPPDAGSDPAPADDSTPSTPAS